MTRTFKLVMTGTLGAWLLMGAGCEDKACKNELQQCKKESSDQRKESAAHMTTITELKTLLAETQSKVENLTKENTELKAKADDTAKSKAKPTKGKKKKRSRK